MNFNRISNRYCDYIPDDVSNGDGIGLVIFTQGCINNCTNCQNKHTWDTNSGKIFDDTIMDEILNYYKNNWIATRLTLSGGDPIYNLEFTYNFLNVFKEKYPNIEIWIYTGYTFENLIEEKNNKLDYILKNTDVLVDGKYIDELRDLTLQFRGSSNQRIIDVRKSLKNKRTILWES